MVLAHNLTAMNAQRQFNIVGTAKKKSTEKLSSGYKINRAADDAAGLSISEKMRKQIRGLDRASDNCQDGVSLCQVADGALAETQDMLQRLTELSVQAANGTLSSSDRDAIQKEVNQIKEEINRISENTKFNEVYPLKGDDLYVRNQNTIDSARIKIDEIGNKWIIPNDIKEYSVKIKTYDACIIDGVHYKAGDITIATYLGIPRTCDFDGEEYGLFMDMSLIPAGSITKGFEDNMVGGSSKRYYSLSIGDLNVDSHGRIYYNSKSYEGKSFYPSFNAPVKDDNGIIRHSGGFADEAHDHLEKYLKAEPYDSEADADSVLSSAININIHAGADSDMTNKIGLHTVDASANVLGISNLNLTTEESATNAIDEVGKALQVVSDYRSYFGAVQNRMEHTIANLDNVVENTQAAESRIRDTDMATEMVNNTKLNILEQAVTSMMTQANQSTQGVLSLLQ